MDVVESNMVVVSSAFSLFLPIYAIVMAGLSAWLFRRTQLQGSAVLMAGFGGTVLIHVVSRFLTSIAFNSWEIIPSTAKELPAWFWTSSMLLTALGLVCNVIIVIGFAMLCTHLVHRSRAGNAVPSATS
jgi:hypothetical protein